MFNDPDALLAGLKRELARTPKAAHAAIEAEIARVENLPRPEARVEAPEVRVNPLVAYLAGLERELARVGDETRDQIKAEIGRVKALLRGGESRADAAPKVEQAVTKRGPGRPPKAAE